MRKRLIGLLSILMAFTLLGACDGESITTVDEVDVPAVSTAAALQAAYWAPNVTLSFEDGSVRYRSNGLPSHERQAEYAVPLGGVRIPTAATAVAIADPSRAQSYDLLIPTEPTKAASPTPTSLGTIGVMISGAALFNPYEGDGVTVATASNFTVQNAAGESVAFLDACNGHPSPMGMYHYHALPPCVTSMVDVEEGPSHLIGIAFDGYPIYGNRDIDGREVSPSALDECSGITSPTPEFPEGIYHYVLLPTTDASSSIRCFYGLVTISASMPPMPQPGPVGS